jgi:hypothetical protein
MLVTDQYKSYNFSSTKCLVIPFLVDYTIKKIEAKIPPVARKLRGIFISAKSNSSAKLIGTINLNFNDGALKPYNLPVINSNGLLKNTVPIAFDEAIKPHSNVTGYYRDFGTGAFGMGSVLFISIYIHYTV